MTTLPNDKWEAFKFPVDLLAFEKQHGQEPVFTWELLKHIEVNLVIARSEIRKPSKHRTVQLIQAQGTCGMYNVWNEKMQKPWEDVVCVEYMSRIQLHPGFQEAYWSFTDASLCMRACNKELTDQEKSWIPVLYVFRFGARAKNDDHKNDEIMRAYYGRLSYTGRLWLKSSSRTGIRSVIKAMMSRSKPITKIVCIGLGAISLRSDLYHSSIQHMTMFSIASMLEETHRQSVEIVLQDPCYSTKDVQLLRKLWGRPLTYATDPDAINASTLVATAHLPFCVPMLQTIADLGTEDSERAPAAILCDGMELDVKKKMYSVSDRSSPSAARFLTGGYDVQGFEDNRLESAL